MMGLEAEYEEENDEINPPKPKEPPKKKSENKLYCETIMDVSTSNQQEAIQRLSTQQGLEQMQKWIIQAKNDKNTRRLCMLLAQCFHAPVSKDTLSGPNVGIGKLINDLKNHENTDVKTAASEVVKKWKTVIVNDFASSQPKNLVKNAASSTVNSSSASSAAPSKAFSHKMEVAKNISKPPRPKTVRTKESSRRFTGFEADAESVEITSKPIAAIPSRPVVGLSKANPVTKKPVISNTFMDALSSGSTSNAQQLQMQRKKLPAIIDAPPAKDGVVTVAASVPSYGKSFKLEQSLGPDPNRVPPPGGKRRIHFADDKGGELVQVKLIELELRDRSGRRDLKHADAENEKNLKELMQLKFENEEDGDEDNQRDVEMQEERVNTAPWKLIKLSIANKKITNEELIMEEQQRQSQLMRSFYHPGTPIINFADDDVKSATANTSAQEPGLVPLDYNSEDIGDDDGMEVDQIAEVPPESTRITSPVATLHPATTSNYSSSPASALGVSNQLPIPPPVAPKSENEGFQIISDIDIHSTSPLPIPNPLVDAPKPVPPPQKPADDLVILDTTPSALKINLDLSSLMERIKSKGVDNLIESFNKKNSASSNLSPVRTAPPASFGPVPSVFTNAPAVLPVTPVNDFIEVPMDIHSMSNPQPFKLGFRPPAPSRPPASSKEICRFFLKGTCTFGDKCFNLHVMPGQGPNAAAIRPAGRGGGITRPSRFNPSNDTRFGSSSNQPEDNDFYRFDGNRRPGSKRRDDSYQSRASRRRETSPYRNNRRSRSPSPRRRNRSRSRSPRRRNRRERESPGRSLSPSRSRSKSASRSPIP